MGPPGRLRLWTGSRHRRAAGPETEHPIPNPLQLVAVDGGLENLLHSVDLHERQKLRLNAVRQALGKVL